MLRVLSLAFALFATWLLWSGHMEAFFIVLGLISAGLVVYIAQRMTVVDEEGVPVQLGHHILTYWAWLLVEIVKANLNVAKIILSPEMRISPTIVRVTALQKTDLGKVIFANSIILTPATLTLDIHEGVLTVHALTKEQAQDVEDGEMNRRVVFLEGRKPSEGSA